MFEVVEVRRLAQAKALLHPVRVHLLHHLAEERTCRELAELLDLSQQRVNHHLKEMLKAKLIARVRTNRKGNLLEAVYQRSSKAYWFSPELARFGVPSQQIREELSLHNLLVIAETLQLDVVRLLADAGTREIPSLGFDAEVVLSSDAQRQEFTKDILRAFHQVSEKYQGPASSAGRFKVTVTCYPKIEEH